MRARARGAGLLIAVLLIVTVASFAVIVGASQLGGDVQGNDAVADSIEALYLAESGVERALKRYATGVAACGALAEPAFTNLAQFGPVGDFPRARTITILDGFTTDFGNPPVALVAAETQCRVRVTATISGSNVSRTIHAIVDRNLLEGPDNPNFNNPFPAGAPTGWTITTTPPVGYPVGFAGAGGADCTRSAWLVKTAQNAFEARSQTSVPVAFTVTAGSQTIVTFHWRLGSRTPVAGCAAGGNTGPAFPGAPCPLPAGDAQVCFRLNPAGVGGSTFMQKNVAGVSTAVACPGTIDPGTPGPYAPCANQYQVPATAGMVYPNKEQLTFNMAATGAVNNFLMNIRLRNAGRKEIFIDHLEVRNTTAIGAAHVRVWRDCSSAADPATCL